MTDPPVAVAADVRGLALPVIDLVGPDTLIVFVVLCCYCGHDIGVTAAYVKICNFIFCRIRVKLRIGYLGIIPVLILAVDIVAGNLWAAILGIRL